MSQSRSTYVGFILKNKKMVSEPMRGKPTNDVILPVGRLTLFAGNDGKGSLVCNLSWNAYGTEFGITEYNWNFKKFDECENDEARYVC